MNSSAGATVLKFFRSHSCLDYQWVLQVLALQRTLAESRTARGEGWLVCMRHPCNAERRGAASMQREAYARTAHAICWGGRVVPPSHLTPEVLKRTTQTLCGGPLRYAECGDNSDSARRGLRAKPDIRRLKTQSRKSGTTSGGNHNPAKSVVRTHVSSAPQRKASLRPSQKEMHLRDNG